jgi:NAD(P)-dependent dehydrogenase (short-subunit alcohol dehydrogenase family)
LLDAGSKSSPDFPSSIVNITSVSGVIRLAQNHFAYNTSKAAAGHLTRMLATELALKNINVRVNAIGPGVYASEITYDKIDTPDLVNRVGKGLMPVPAARAGT